MQGIDAAWFALLPAFVLLSACLTGLSIGYAHRRQLIDHPGRRRSHDLPTPRGGGIGIVISVVAGLVLQGFALDGSLNWGESQVHWGPSALLMLIAAISLVAIVGWIDDHRGLGAGLRLGAHWAAAVLLGLPALLLLAAEWAANPAAGWMAAAMLVCCVAVVWSINLHNFMDGINGLLACQAVFVLVVLAWICAQAGRGDAAWTIALFAAATLGFLPFNFPHARIFMGDVGSGVVGLLVAVAIGWQIAATPALWMAGLIAVSAFMVDSTCTLLSRMLSGRRWYSAHREHLYQWLVRSGFSHKGTVGLYMGWNLLVVLPALYWCGALNAHAGNLSGKVQGSQAMLAVYALAVVAWIFGKRYCLGKRRINGS
ncbi:glycosyltransferase family 4 protein [Dokdonella sp.]|uniref:MraY family glycosyltransferase n=1 Tax=Dokdonella sp. TaxID=2291710 RepID=UPI003526DCAD